MACALCPPAARPPYPCSSCSRDTRELLSFVSRPNFLRPTDRDREECQSFRLARSIARSFLRPSELMAERQDRNLGPTKFRSWWDCGEVLIMEGKLAPPPKFYSGPLFRNTCDLICPLGKAILLRQIDEISPHVSGLC